MYVAKLLLIYRDVNGMLCGIVHGCAFQTMDEVLVSTSICSRYFQEFHLSSANGKKTRPSRRKGQPWLRKIPLDHIKEIVYTVDHAGEEPTSLGLNVPETYVPNVKKRYVDVLEPRVNWAKIFLEQEK
jgi:hypothetical protein